MDTCKYGGGGWNIDLKFWWNLEFPLNIQRHTHLENNKSGKIGSINVFIVNFAVPFFPCHINSIDLLGSLTISTGVTILQHVHGSIINTKNAWLNIELHIYWTFNRHTFGHSAGMVVHKAECYRG